MHPVASLLPRFLTHLRAGQEAGEAERAPQPGLEDQLGALLAAGRAAWPALPLQDDDVLRYLAERVPEAAVDLSAALADLHVADLYLACACALGSPQALSAFERHCFAELPASLGRLSSSTEFHDEVRQAVRTRLFVSEPGARPRIEEYAGRGPLAGWVRIVALRLAVDRLRAVSKQPLAVDGDVLQHLAIGADPELGLLSAQYRDEVQAAFLSAFAALQAAERNLLRLHHLDGLTLDEIAAMKRMHRSSVARRIARCREQVAARTRDLLVERLGLDPSQIDSVIRLVRSQIDLRLEHWRGRSDRR